MRGHSNQPARHRALIIVFGILVQAPAFAQEQNRSKKKEAEAAREERDVEEKAHEQIIVTGSLFNRPSVYEGRSPIQSLDWEQLSGAGATQLSDALKTITVNTGSTLAVEQRETQGTSQFSLRGLGLGSTLTLINGRRAGLAPVSDAAGNFFFDINSIPLIMIERIDILTDGASATYGSEAVAGVANVITRRNFEGLEIAAGATDSSNRSYDFGFALGSSHDKGHVTVFGAYYQHTRNFRTDFDWIVDRVTAPGGDVLAGRHTSPTGSPGSYTRAVLDPTTGLYQRAQNGTQLADVHCVEAGGILDADGDTCRLFFADQRTVIPDEERVQIFAESDYQFTDRIKAFTELGYSVNKVTDRIGAGILDNGNLASGQGFHIPASHPFNFWVADPSNPGGIVYVDPSDPGWANGTLQAVDLAATARPLGNEVNGKNAAKLEREFRNTRILSGLHFDLSDTWSGTASWSYADNRFVEIEPHNYIVDVFTQLVEEGRWNPFGTRLTDPNLVSPKPNSGGVTAGNDPETQALFDGFGVQSRQAHTTVVELLARGDLVDAGFGTIRLALGAQYRDLEYDRTPDSLEAAQEGNQTVREFRVHGTQDVYALFAESLVPIAKRGEVQLAARYEDYGAGVNTTDPKLAAEFKATDWFRIRGSWGTSFQAPTLTQVAGEQTFGTLTDFEVVENGQSVCRQNSTENNITIQKRVGSRQLEPQSANNFNIGALFAPWRKLRFGLDYWNYRYKDLIGLDSNAQTLVTRTCLNPDGSFREGLPPNPSDRVVRNAAGQLVSTTSNFINTGKIIASGLDFNASHDMKVIGLGLFQLSLRATLIRQFRADVDGDGTFEDRLGFRNSDLDAFAPQPALRWVAGGAWTHRNHTANLTTRYIDGFKQDENPTDPISEVSEWVTVDAQYSYRLPDWHGHGHTVMTLGANNVFDRNPPGLPGAGVVRPGYEGAIHDIRGRQIYLRLKHTF